MKYVSRWTTLCVVLCYDNYIIKEVHYYFIMLNSNTELNRYQLNLIDNLNTLLAEDSAMLNDVIVEYVTLLGNTNRMHDMHDYTCQELENDWGLG